MAMTVKLFEIRDAGTFIPAVGILMESDEDSEQWLLRRVGYRDARHILLTRIEGRAPANADPYDWPNRTMQGAHLYIEKHWDELKSGDVVDARVGLGEATEPAESERYL